MKRKISMILVLVLVIGTLLPSMAFAAPYKNLNMEQYMLKSFNSRIFNDLPWGLAKRGEDNLPWGLQKRLEDGGIGYLPHGLTKEFHADNFELYVIKMILKYDRDEIEIEEIIEAIEALLLEDPINEGAIEDKLEELKETYLWYQFIDKVELIIAGCGDLNTTLTAKIERYISADNPNHRKEIEELIEEFQELCDAQKRYDDLVYEIEEFLEGDLTGFGDRDTYDSFMDTFNDWNDLVDPDYAELLEAIGVLEALLDYLDDMFTIDEGSSFLNRYKEHMRNIVENSEFETGEGFGLYFPIVETTFDGYIAEIDGLTNPELFDIILIISEVKEFLDIYEDMRYVTLLENDDYIAKRAEVLGLTSEIGALDDEDLDLLFEEFVSLTDDLDVVDYITLAQYNDFVEKYDELKAIYSSF